jgi:hypothetical protein
VVKGPLPENPCCLVVEQSRLHGAVLPDLKFFSPEPSAPKWYFEKLYFPNSKTIFKKRCKKNFTLKMFI